MDEETIEDRIDNLRPTLVAINNQSGQAAIDDESINQIIALLKMLTSEAADPAWRFDQCDAFVAKLVTDFTTGRLTPDQLRDVMAAMAAVANARIIDPTEQNVEMVRRGILYLLLAGATFAALQTLFPGFLSLILESAYALFLVLKDLITSNGIPEEAIITEITTNPSPFSAGVFLTAAAQASMNLINAAFNVCADAASICGQAVGQAVAQIPDCLNYAAELLAFALATKVAEPVADATGRAASAVVAAASGSQDAAIATWIRNDGAAKFRAAMGANADAFANAAVENTKRVIREALEGMNDVYEYIYDPSRVPNRYAAINVNDSIIYWLQEYVSRFRDAKGVALTRLMTELSTIDFEHGEEIKQASITHVAQKLGLENLYDQRFIELLTAYTLAVDKQSIRKSVSLRTEYRQKPSKLKDLTQSASLPIDYNYPFDAAGNPMVVSNVEKRVKQNGPNREFDDDVTNVKSQINLNPRLQADLNNVGITKTTRFPPRSSKYNDRLVLNVVAMYLEKDQNELINVIDKVVTVLPKGITPGAKETANKTNMNKYLAAIEDFLKDKEPNKGGGRGRKSRRYRKKRSTLKRHRMKRRRLTRKGRKRRHTKRR